MRHSELASALVDDVRYAMRQLRQAPGFTIVAALTLALGIGATTAIFSAVHAVVLRPLPFRAPERLVRVYMTSPTTTPTDEVSPRMFAAWRDGSRALERVAAVETRSLAFAEGEQPPQQVDAVRASADYFRVLGAAPELGRTFLAEEDAPGRDRAVVLSHRFWHERFGGDRSVVGRTVRVNAVPVRIVGVMPASFDVSGGDVDVWTPLALSVEDETSSETGYLGVVARLRAGASAERAQAELSAIATTLGRGGQAAQWSARVVDLSTDVVGPYRTRLLVLLGAVAYVLLIACVNVANLLLARGAGRAKQLAIRAALGAGRARVARQLLTENLVLASRGGAAGLALAVVALRLLRTFGPPGVPRLSQASVDPATLAFTGALVVGSALLFGLVPAMRASAADL